jgi:hypothetical protein
MAFLDDLIKAGATFNEGIAEVRITEEINNANAQMQEYKDQLQQGALNQNKFRQQANQLGQALTAQLVKLDADPNRVQQAFAAIAPKQYGNSMEARLAGEDAWADELDKADFENKKKLLNASNEADIQKYWATSGKLEMYKAGLKANTNKNKQFVDGMVLVNPDLDEKTARANAGAIYNSRGLAARAKSSVQEYLDMVKKHGNTGWTPESRGDLNTYREKAIMSLQKFYELGVLQKLDKDQIEQMLGASGLATFDSTTLRGAQNMIGTIDKELSAFSNARGFRDEADDNFEKNYAQPAGIQEILSPERTTPAANKPTGFIKYTVPGLQQKSSMQPNREPAVEQIPSELSTKRMELQNKLNDRGELAKEAGGRKTASVVNKYKTQLAQVESDIKLASSNPEAYNKKSNAEKLKSLANEKRKLMDKSNVNFSSYSSRKNRLKEIEQQIQELAKTNK